MSATESPGGSPHIDGNAAAGPLDQIFAAEVTTAFVTCSACATCEELARAMVYGRPPAVVLRCRSCGDVLLTLVSAAGGRTRLGLSGVASIDVVVPESAVDDPGGIASPRLG